MSLKDALLKLRQDEQHNTDWEQDKPRIIRDWRESITSLMETIRGYLADYEADGSMSFSMREIELSEEVLGDYTVSAMSIDAGPVKLIVEPVGRMIIGARGRVDIYRQGRGGEQNRIILLMVPESATDTNLIWATFTPPEVGAPNTGTFGLQRRPLVPLTKDILEQLLELLLR